MIDVPAMSLELWFKPSLTGLELAKPEAGVSIEAEIEIEATRRDGWNITDVKLLQDFVEGKRLKVKRVWLEGAFLAAVIKHLGEHYRAQIDAHIAEHGDPHSSVFADHRYEQEKHASH